MSDYMDPSRYEPAIGPMEDEFCGMLDDYDPADSAAHDRLVAFVAHMEMKLATSNNQLEYIEGIATAEGKTMQQRLTAIEDCFRRDAPTKAFTPPSAARLQALEKVYQKASELIAFIGHNGEAYSTHGQVEDLTCALDDCDRASVTKGAAPPTDDAKQLLREAAPYIESFAQLTKHPTAPADARVLIDRIYAYTNARGAPTKSACCRQSPCLHPGVGPCDKEYWGATTTGNTAYSTGEGLTLEKIRSVIDSLPKLPPPPKYDLYGSAAIDQAYEINPTMAMRWIPMPPGCEGRKMLVVPKKDLDWWYRTLLRHGADVRLEPRIGPASSQGEGA